MNQAGFARALLDPEFAVPEGIIDPNGRPASKRFSVYRNNVTSGLTKALEASFPVIRKLVGDEFFAAMAVVFARAHPPRSRLLAQYGDAFPDFLSRFPPVSHLGYLADVARLEQAIRESYHAADLPALPPRSLATLSEARLQGARLHLSPTVRLIRSKWPIQSIWLANTEGGPPPAAKAEDVIVLRPSFDPRPHLLPSGAGAFPEAVLAGRSLVEALCACGDGFDLASMLSLLFDGNAIVGITE